MKKKIKYLSVILAFIIMIINSLPGTAVKVNASDLENVSEGSIAEALSETGDGLTATPTVPEDVTVEMGGDASAGTEGSGTVGTEDETGLWTVTVTYNLAGAEDATGVFKGGVYQPAPITGGYADEIYFVTPKEEPTKEGYAFGGWLYSGDGEVYEPGVEIVFTRAQHQNAEITFTAMWEAVTVVFDYNDGISEKSSEIITNQKLGEVGNFTIVLATKPARTNYRFLGWLCSVDNKIYEAGIEKNDLIWNDYAGTEITFTAQWEELPNVNVIYVSDGKTVSENSIYMTDDAVFNLTVIHMVPTKDCNRSNGWLWEHNNSLYASNYLIEKLSWEEFYNKTTTFTAQWIELPSVNVEFVRHDGEVVTFPEQQKTEDVKNLSIELPVDDSEYVDYKFVGWKCSIDDTTYGVDDIPVFLWEKLADGETITFTSVWEKLSSVTLEYVRHDKKIVTKTVQETAGEDAFMVEMPVDDSENPGYKYVGWKYKIGDGEYSEDIVISRRFSWNELKDAEKITFESQWEPIVTVKYMNGETEFSSREIRKEKDADSFVINIPEETPQEMYFKFAGWTCDIDEGNSDEEIIYAQGDVLPELKWETYEGQTITFTAQWENLPCVNIHFISGDESWAEVINQPDEGVSEFSVELPSDIPVLEHRIFTGWHCTQNDTLYEPESEIKTVSFNWSDYANGGISFVAQWKWDDYSIFETGKQSLTTDNLYYLINGSWILEEDGYSYAGDITFGVSEDGDYTFQRID